MLRSALSISILFLIILSTQCSKKREIIKIGFTAGLSGPLSELGVQSRDGVLLAVQKINKSKNSSLKRIEVIVKDHAYSPQKIKKIIRELEDEGVSIIIGPLLSKMAKPALDALKGKNALLISPSVTTDKLKGIDDSFIMIMPVASIEGAALAELTIKNDIKRVAVIYDIFNKEYTESVLEGFQNIYKSSNRKIVYVNNLNKKSLNAYSRISRNIKRLNCDGVIMICSSIDATKLAHQLRKNSVNIRKYGISWGSLGEAITHGGSAVEDMIFVSTYKGNEDAPAFKEFQKNFKYYYKHNVDFISEYSYETVFILNEAINKTGSTNANKIKNYIIKKRIFKGLRDNIFINKYGDAKRKSSSIIIKNGRFQILNK